MDARLQQNPFPDFERPKKAARFPKKLLDPDERAAAFASFLIYPAAVCMTLSYEKGTKKNKQTLDSFVLNTDHVCVNHPPPTTEQHSIAVTRQKGFLNNVASYLYHGDNGELILLGGREGGG